MTDHQVFDESPESPPPTTSQNETIIDVVTNSDSLNEDSNSSDTELDTTTVPDFVLKPRNITRKRKRSETEDPDVVFLKLKVSTYIMRSGQRMSIAEGDMPQACSICYHFKQIHEISTSLVHLSQHPSEYVCKQCSKVLLETDAPCSLCRAKFTHVQCKFCSNIFPKDEVILNFHGHLDDHACYLCLSIMLRQAGTTTKLLKCPSHEEKTYVDLNSVKGATPLRRRVMSVIAVMQKSADEIHRELVRLLPESAKHWQNCTWNVPLRTTLADHTPQR